MKKQIVVIHGGDSFRTHGAYISFLKNRRIDPRRYLAGRRDWKKGLGATLGKGYEVILPDMPNKLNAKYAEWKIWFEKFIPHLKSGVILIGHSLGALFLAKYLSENDFPKTIRATMLVAPPWSEGDFRLKKNLRGLEERGGQIFLYQSKDDRVAPFVNFRKYRKALKAATPRIFERKGHFNQENFSGLVNDIKNLFR